MLLKYTACCFDGYYMNSESGSWWLTAHMQHWTSEEHGKNIKANSARCVAANKLSICNTILGVVVHQQQ